MGKEMILNKMTARDVGFDLTRESVNFARQINDLPKFRKEIIEITARQIRTYESETLEDNVVSFYPCYIHNFGGKARLFSADTDNEKFLIQSSIDPLERDGSVLQGFEILQDKIDNDSESKFFLWISPRGSAGTQGIYKDINYGYHQIYMGEINGKDTRAYALKSDIREDLLAVWVNNLSDGSARITGTGYEDFLLNPVVKSSLPGAHFLETALFRLKLILEKSGQKKFYKDINIDDMPQLIRLIRNKSLQQENDMRRIAESLRQSISGDRYFGYEEARQAIGGQLYVLYGRYADEWGEVMLKGCAGGNMKLRNIVSGILRGFENIFSTQFRLDQKESYSFDTLGRCKRCGNERYLGPCGICEPCDEELSRDNDYEIAA